MKAHTDTAASSHQRESFKLYRITFLQKKNNIARTGAIELDKI